MRQEDQAAPVSCRILHFEMLNRCISLPFGIYHTITTYSHWRFMTPRGTESSKLNKAIVYQMSDGVKI